jgi:hypothetical protein
VKVLTNAIEWARAHPELFFRSGDASPLELFAYVAKDVFSRGGVLVARVVDDWTLVGSETNWMSHPVYAPEELFGHVVTAPEQEVHSMRGEVIVAAFATSVALVVGDRGRIVIHGDPPGEALWSLAEGFHCSLLFRSGAGA